MLVPLPLLMLMQRSADALVESDYYQQAITELDGKVVQCQVTHINTSLYFMFVDGGVNLERFHDGGADARISGSLVDLVSLLQADKSIMDSDVEIAGDGSVARKFGRLMSSIDIDWEEGLSVVTGDTVARKTRVAHDTFLQGLRRTRDRFMEDTSAWLQDEKKLVETDIEVSAFCTEVDTLRDDAERLEARIAMLEQRQSSTRSPADKA